MVDCKEIEFHLVVLVMVNCKEINLIDCQKINFHSNGLHREPGLALSALTCLGVKDISPPPPQEPSSAPVEHTRVVAQPSSAPVEQQVFHLLCVAQTLELVMDTHTRVVTQPSSAPVEQQVFHRLCVAQTLELVTHTRVVTQPSSAPVEQHVFHRLCVAQTLELVIDTHTRVVTQPSSAPDSDLPDQHTFSVL
jgi:hypothetical protein